MLRASSTIKACCFAALACLSSVAIAAEDIKDAEASFKFIANTLQTFRGSGALLNNPGIDDADFERFATLLDEAYLRFSRNFNSESGMCRFYRDPENSRMTIEERAELSFSFLRALEDRIALYRLANAEFKEDVEDQFGQTVLESINRIKETSVSHQRLPSSVFDEAATINFLDSQCG